MILTIKTVLGMYDKTKTGKPLLTKNGKPYQKANVTFKETGEKIISMNVWQGSKCEVGQVLEGEVTEREWQGKKYYDLKVANKDERQALEIAQIKFSLAKHDSQIKEIQEFIRKQFPGKVHSGTSPDLTSAGTKVPDFSEVNAELETIYQDENE